jgi:aerobic-type carbon monoxide dehydrogenase small subunit (CoxS/CutS family)
MKSHALLAECPNPTREQLKEELAGNLCRCTGFVKIYEAVERAASELREKAPTQPAPVAAR